MAFEWIPEAAAPIHEVALQVVQEIKVMRSGVTAREKERAERATLVQQEKLSKAKVLHAASLKRLLQSRVITAAPLQAPKLPAWNELLSA